MSGFAPPKSFRGSGNLRSLLESNWRYLGTYLNSVNNAVGDWQDYTPSTTATLGNGVLEGRYLRVGKLITVHFFFKMGSTSTMASNPKWGLPVDFADAVGETNQTLGAGTATDASPSAYYSLTCQRGDAVDNFVFRLHNGTNVSSTTPFTWATGDTLSTTLSYEAAE